MRPGWILTTLLVLVAVVSENHQCLASSSPPSSSGMVLRIRLADGSMEKVLVPKGAEDTMTLDDILKPFSRDEDMKVQVGSKTIEDLGSSPLSQLDGVKHGSLITLQYTNASKPTESRFSQLKVDPDQHRWDPFPDLAKNYEHALLKTKTRRSSGKGMSYGDLAHLQSSLHIVEPQPEGPLKRVYMCRNSAERFQVNGLTKKTGIITPRVGLLLGTVQKERVDKTPRKARTSLSSQVSDSDYCTVAKVQAVWEPSGQTMASETGSYDASVAEGLMETNLRVLSLADRLGLVPVGWIFSYTDPRHEDSEALPIYGLDIQVGGTLQIAKMKGDDEDNNSNSEARRLEGKKFVTLAMDATTGATEAFQLSDVSVQMVHESILQPSLKKKGGRTVPTKHAVLVDGKESKELDSVLCLVNTAMLPHVGSYSGKTAVTSVKKNGGLTNKTKKKLLGLFSENDDLKLLEELCDFNTLLALDQSLAGDDSKRLCHCVKKWARGQKQGTQLDSKLKLKLRGILES